MASAADGAVLVGQRRTDVRRGEDREDVGLHHLDEGLEERHDDREEERERRQDVEDERVGDGEHVLAAEDEHQQQQVAGEHVAEQPQRERDRPQDEVREELDRGQHDPDPGPGTPGGQVCSRM